MSYFTKGKLLSEKPLYGQLIKGAISIILLSVAGLFYQTKDKKDLNLAEGRITMIEKKYKEYPYENTEKCRYIKIDNYDRVFELFVGKDEGDFKPKMERIDELKVGDTIKVYYVTNMLRDDPEINRLVRFIDLKERPYFIKDNFIIGGLWFCLTMGVAMGVWAIVYKRMGKII